MPRKPKEEIPEDMEHLLAKLKIGDRVSWRDVRGYDTSAHGIYWGCIDGKMLIRYWVSRRLKQDKTIRVPYGRINWDSIRNPTQLEEPKVESNRARYHRPLSVNGRPIPLPRELR